MILDVIKEAMAIDQQEDMQFCQCKDMYTLQQIVWLDTWASRKEVYWVDVERGLIVKYFGSSLFLYVLINYYQDPKQEVIYNPNHGVPWGLVFLY